MYLSATAGVRKVFIVIVLVVTVTANVSCVDTHKQKLGVNIMRAVIFEGGVSRVSFCPRIGKFDLLDDVGRRRNIDSGIGRNADGGQNRANADDEAKHSLQYIFIFLFVFILNHK